MATPDRITDPRDVTFEQTDTLIAEIFDARLTILRREAAAEAQIATIRETLQEETADERRRLELAEARLSAAIHAHREAYQKRRMRVTPWGKYGLRTSTRVEIDDPDLVISHAKSAGQLDLVRTTESVNKDAVARRLRAGEAVPGTRLDQAEASEYKLDTAALEAEL